MTKRTHETLGFLTVWFMTFFVPSPGLFGLTLFQWATAWGIPFCLIILGVVGVVAFALIDRLYGPTKKRFSIKSKLTDEQIGEMWKAWGGSFQGGWRRKRSLKANGRQRIAA